MKKLYKMLICTFFLCVCVTGVSFASITRSFSDSQNLRNWSFDFGIGQYGGFNIDKGSYGLETDFSMSMESVFSDDDYNQEFIYENSLEGKRYAGVIVIENFEIAFEVDDEFVTDDSKTYVTPTIKWGKVEGIVYVGAFFLSLIAEDHDDQFVKHLLDDEDAEFTTIDYSVIPLSVTASYSEQAVETGDDSLVYDLSHVNTAGGAVPTTMIDERDSGAVLFGYDFEDVMKVRLGLSTEYSFKQKDSEDYVVPLSASVLLDFTPFERFRFQVFNGVVSGINGRYLFEKDNPYVVRALTGYRFSLGPNYFLTPQFGAKVGFMNSVAVDPDATFSGYGVDEDKNTEALVAPYEVTAGVVFDWRSLGIDGLTDDYITYNVSVSDTVRDGIGFAASYGETPHTVFRDLMIPYIGMKMTIWEYEYQFGNDRYDDEQVTKSGLIPGLAMSFVGNLNYVLGGKYSDFHDYFDDDDSLVESDIRTGARMDMGLAGEFSYKISFLRHKFGVIYKLFDMNETTGVDIINEEDLRMKIGFDVVQVVPYSIFSIDWYSGDMFDDVASDTDFTEYDFFYASHPSGLRSFDSHAKFGYVSLGLVYKFRR